ncbi:MAG: hypothetical protein ACLRSW_00385 [Christensenellaceae bacterium]
MIMPTIASLAKNSLEAASKEYYEGSLGLGNTKDQTVFRVMLPAAKSGYCPRLFSAWAGRWEKPSRCISSSAARPEISRDALYARRLPHDDDRAGNGLRLSRQYPRKRADRDGICSAGIRPADQSRAQRHQTG